MRSRCFFNVFPDLLELEQVVGDRVVGTGIVADAELGNNPFDRCLPGFVQTVPEGEDPAVVAVKVFGIAAVVDHMHIGRVEDLFDPSERRQQLGMQRELVERVHDKAGGDHDGFEAKNGHPQPVDRLYDRDEPTIADANREVERLGRMVRQVCGR